MKPDLVGADPIPEAHHGGFDVAHRHRVAAALLPDGRSLVISVHVSIQLDWKLDTSTPTPRLIGRTK